MFFSAWRCRFCLIYPLFHRQPAGILVPRWCKWTSLANWGTIPKKLQLSCLWLWKPGGSSWFFDWWNRPSQFPSYFCIDSTHICSQMFFSWPGYNSHLSPCWICSSDIPIVIYMYLSRSFDITILYPHYPLVMTNIAMENDPLIDGLPGFTYYNWWFSMAMHFLTRWYIPIFDISIDATRTT